jgi:RimJ/RimL family protein N-acetyltransferase
MDRNDLKAAPDHLVTPRLRLETPRPAHVAAFAEGVAASMSALAFVRWGLRPRDLEWARRFCEDDARSVAAGDDRVFHVFEIDGGAWVGRIDVHTLDVEAARGEIGYVGDVRRAGRGLMREAALAVIASCFALGFERIEAMSDARNVRALRFAEALGMRREGLLRGHERDVQGQRCDMVLYATLGPHDAPATAPAADRLAMNLLIRGFEVSRLLGVAAGIGLADALPLSVGRDIAELAGACHVQAIPLTRLVRALAAFDVFRLAPDGRVSHTPLSLLLRADDAASLRPAVLALTGRGSWRAWGELEAALQGEVPHLRAWGAGRFDYLRDHPDEARHFDAFMAHDPTDRHGAIAAAYDFGAARLIVDVGGGNGALLRRILARHAGPTGLVFDRDDVVAAIDAKDLADGRLATEGGSFLDGVPAGASHYLLVRVLHDGPDAECLRVLRHCRVAMAADADARLLIAEQILEPDPSRGAPLQYLGDLQMMAMFGSARERTLAEFRALLDDAGFVFSGVIATASALSLVEATPRR